MSLLNVGVVSFQVLSHASFHHAFGVRECTLSLSLSSPLSLYPTFYLSINPLDLCRTTIVWYLFSLIETPKVLEGPEEALIQYEISGKSSWRR